LTLLINSGCRWRLLALYIFQTFRYPLSLIILRIFPFEEGSIQTNLVWSFLQCDQA